ncbi:MAG: hypothetical protein JWN44_5714 [Myxococcales bacterium]|nr:hypothetical protein [Myxococcales bacterium]
MTTKLLPVLLAAAFLGGCGSPSNNNNNNDTDMGGGGGSGGCSATAACTTAGATRCASAASQETCTAEASGCLEWVASACSASQICGDPGDGTSNKCVTGVPCTCPTGYSCDAQGVCTGGNGAAIGIDVKTVSVAGVVTLNGAAPATLPSCNPNPTASKATVHLVDVARGYSFDLPVPCSTTSFAWSGVIFPGTYKVTVTGDSNYSSLPIDSFVANAQLDVKADAQNVALDVKTAQIGGTLTLNGAAPTTDATCTGNPNAAKATVHLYDATNGYHFDLDVPCSSTTFAWGGVVFPGTYALSVDGDRNYTNVPATAFIANKSLAVTGTVASQAIDVKTVTAAGTLTLNGAVPTATCPASSTAAKATVHLSDAKQGYHFDLPIPCSQTGFAWSGSIYPGTYKVSASDGGNGYSNLPQTAFVANAALQVSANVSNQALDLKTVTVGGTITLNGTAPAATTFCTSNPSATQATVTLTDATNGYLFNVNVPCSSTTLAWTGTVFPGTYNVTVHGQPSYSTLPNDSFLAKDGFAVSANAANVALDVKTATVAGSITLNGTAPTSTPSCGSNPSQIKATVHLTNAKLGYSFDLPVQCSSSSFAFSGEVFPATYVVRVSGGSYSNVPAEPFQANGALAVSSNVSGQALDVKTTSVGGTLTLNGAAPSTTTSCNPNPTASKAHVNFYDATSGYAFNVPVACSSASFAWSGVVYPGTYRISVDGDSGYSNLPSEGFLVTPRLKVQ